MRYYDRQGEPITLMEFAFLFERHDYRTVKVTTWQEHRAVLSTVWIGIDHSNGIGEKQIFEMALFMEGETSRILDRYSNERDAAFEHKMLSMFINGEENVKRALINLIRG